MAPPPLVELRGVSKKFVKPLDVSTRIGNLIGARISEEVVHAMDSVDLAIAPGEVVGWSANPVAASRRSGASRSACSLHRPARATGAGDRSSASPPRRRARSSSRCR